ncbi:MAG: c-type cytochrome [SAR324 cluster bacterium]|nr:c-type cytochrome [SAR324 cluster bacterium]
MERGKEDSLKYDQVSSKEYENPFTKWKVWLFYGVLSFIFIWLLYYYLHYLGGASLEEKLLRGTEQTREESSPINSNTENTAIDAVAGKSAFQSNCAACHGLIGEGGIGPNLTDSYWLHGNTEQDITHVISNGIPEKGMASWKGVLDAGQIRNVVTYILTLKESNPANAKAPQGIKY